MAYMLTCLGGYLVPARQGKYSVVGFSATVNDSTVDSEFGIVDDYEIKDSWQGGRLIQSTDIDADTKYVIAYAKGDGSSYDGFLQWTAPEPIKTRHGISIIASNIKPGTLCVYVK